MTDANQAPKDLIGFLDFYLVHRAPFQIPDQLKEILVRFGPWIALVLLVLSLPILLFAFGVGSLFLPFAGWAYATGFGYLTMLTLIEMGLLVAALPGLFARKLSGWNLLFYSQLISIVSSLLHGWILNAVVGGLISLYILFQIRSLYRS
jgi:hypothetical protein